MSTESLVQAVRDTLSSARMSTYDRAVATVGGSILEALELYDWNAQVSGAFMVPLHICEVVMRNAVAEALSGIYGERWPWSEVFETSLPAPKTGYNGRSDLQAGRKSRSTTGKVIPELKFSFWQMMFTGRHDERVWQGKMLQVMPNLDAGMSVTTARAHIYSELEHIRCLRNRIAHHEPIFSRDLTGDLRKMVELIRLRSYESANWMTAHEKVTPLLQARSS